MFMVVSYWEPIPGHEEQFEQVSLAMRDIMRSQPGVDLMHAFDSNGKRVAVVGYTDEATYNAIVGNPNGPFNRALAEYRLEEHATWIGSERGTTVPES